MDISSSRINQMLIQAVYIKLSRKRKSSSTSSPVNRQLHGILLVRDNREYNIIQEGTAHPDCSKELKMMHTPRQQVAPFQSSVHYDSPVNNELGPEKE
jgi:hypothetical protein